MSEWQSQGSKQAWNHLGRAGLKFCCFHALLCVRLCAPHSSIICQLQSTEPRNIRLSISTGPWHDLFPPITPKANGMTHACQLLTA